LDKRAAVFDGNREKKRGGEIGAERTKEKKNRRKKEEEEERKKNMD
jgi:hypothetical protein